MKQNKHLLDMLRAAIAASALVLAFGTALAQGPVQGVPGTPRVDQPNQGGGGGGVGIGINIDLGSVINIIRNATRRDDQTKPPVLQKKAVTVSSGSSGNYTIDWVVQYANNTGATLPKVTVTDGPIATIINPSLVPGLVPQQGWTGTTNGNVPVDNYALFSGTNIAPHGVMTATFPAPFAASMSLAGSGDGYQPIPYTRMAAPAGQRIYFMNHHWDPATKPLMFKCLDLGTGAACIGWALGKPLPAGDGSGNSSGTMGQSSEYTIDNGKLYYASQGSSGIGIGCYNLETDTECGFTYFGTQTTGLHINGPWRVGNELYMADTDGAVYCASLGSSLSPCVGSNYKIPAANIKIHVTKPGFNNYNGGYLAGKVIANKVYITSIQSGTKYTNCFDSTTKIACWNTSAPTVGTAPYNFFTAGSDNFNVSNFLYYDVSGSPVAICTMLKTPAAQLCVDTVNGTAKSGLAVVLPGLVDFGAGLETYLAGKTYFVKSLYQFESREDAYCWNWATQAACTIAPLGKIANNPGGYVANYGSNSDDQGCVWVYGHAGKLWHFNTNSIDVTTGLAKPCGGGSKFIKVFQPLQYCSGPKPFHWTSVEVKGALLANYDKFIVNILNSSNVVLFTKDLKATGQLQANITGIDAQTLSQPLKIEIEYVPKPGMGASDQPYLEVRYNAPPIEFCFKSTHTCEQTKITNTVETPDPAKQGSYISVKVDVVKPRDCTVTPPPPPSCGTATTPACCGQPGQPVCPSPICGQPGQPRCPDPVCIPGTPGCPIIGIGCTPGDPLCNPVRPPPPKPVCLTGDCAPKAEQSTGQEFKEPKVACVRKAKPVEAPVAAAKPRPKPAVAAAPPAPVDPNAPPKPKPKPRPKPAQPKPIAQDDDC